jgi:hypothetical protein
MQRSCKRFLAVGPKVKSSWLVFAGRAGGRRGKIAELKPSHSGMVQAWVGQKLVKCDI